MLQRYALQRHARQAGDHYKLPQPAGRQLLLAEAWRKNRRRAGICRLNGAEAMD